MSRRSRVTRLTLDETGAINGVFLKNGTELRGIRKLQMILEEGEAPRLVLDLTVNDYEIVPFSPVSPSVSPADDDEEA